MSQIKTNAEAFFHACESGKGWDVCQEFCHPDATFSAQAPAIASIDTVQDYTGWIQGLFGPLPDNGYEIKSFGVDEDRATAVVAAVFSGTHTGEGGPVPPTGKKIATDYVYVLNFEAGRIRHMTKIWNDGVGLAQLGWA